MTTPSNEEQLTLELVNRFRVDPDGEYARLVGVRSDIDANLSFFGTSLSALQQQLAALDSEAPLAWSTALSASADKHSDLMIQYDEQSHNLPGEPGLLQRISNENYFESNDGGSVGENIFLSPDDLLFSHAGFVLDWGYDDEDFSNGKLRSDYASRGDGVQDPAGHRNSIMSSTFTEIGIGIVEENNTATDAGKYVTTQHFGSRTSYDAQVLGVVIDDQDSDRFYDIGEGMGGVTVTLSGQGQSYSTTTWSSGGYQLAAASGTYTATFTGGGLGGTITKTVVIGADNVKLDAYKADAAGTNTAPVATVADQTIGLGQSLWKRLDSVLSVTDADNDAISQYQVWDSTGGNNWYADGRLVDASKGYATSDLSGIWFKRDDVASEQTLWVRANDGTEWGAWEKFKLTTEGSNTAPVATVADQTIGLDQSAWKRLDSVLSVTDADGDAITQYRLFDTQGGNNWWADGGLVDAANGYTTNDLSGIWITRDGAASTQTLGIEVFDGTEWSNRETFTLKTAGNNTAPVVEVENQTIGLDQYAWKRLDNALSVTDADGDAITRYQLWDSQGENNWWADGGIVDASKGYTTNDISGVWFTRDSSESTQKLWVRAYDDQEWGAWDSFNLVTE